MAVREVNKELFQKILDQIREHPESHDQRYWENERITFDYRESCGTTRCIAGWAVYFSDTQADSVFDTIDRMGYSSMAQAGAGLLGLTMAEADALFYLKNDEKAVEMVENYALKGREWQ